MSNGLGMIIVHQSNCASIFLFEPMDFGTHAEVGCCLVMKGPADHSIYSRYAVVEKDRAEYIGMWSMWVG